MKTKEEIEKEIENLKEKRKEYSVKQRFHMEAMVNAKIEALEWVIYGDYTLS